MTTQVHKSIEVNVPVSTAYNQWTQFEEFPHFMGGVESVTQLTDDRLEWVAEIAGVKRRWKARILEQVPDHKVAWAAIEGATNAGAVTFADLGGRTQVTLTLEYEPEGLIEKVGDALSVIERQAESDLARFKEFIEAEGYATGAWRGTVDGVGTPGLEDATSQGDSGKAGIGKAAAVAAGIGAAAAGAAVAAGVKKTSDSDVPGVTVTPVPGTTDLGDATNDADFVGGTEADTEFSGAARTAGTGTGGAGTGAGAVETGAGGGKGDELIDDALQPATEESDPAHPTRSASGDDADDLNR